MQTLTNDKSSTVSSWFLTGLNLYRRINQKWSHFLAPCGNFPKGQVKFSGGIQIMEEL